MKGCRQSRSPRPVMTPGLSDPEHTMRGNCRAHDRIARSPTEMRAKGAASERENTLGTLADHVVFKEHLAKEKQLMCAVWQVTVSQAALRDIIVCITRMIEDAMTTFVTHREHNGVKRADSRLQAMSQGLGNKALYEKLNTVEREDRLRRKIEVATLHADK